MLAASTRPQDNASVGELDQIGGLSVLWPFVRCSVCREPVPQRHGVALLAVDGRPVCAKCYPIANGPGGLELAHRVVGASQ